MAKESMETYAIGFATGALAGLLRAEEFVEAMNTDEDSSARCSAILCFLERLMKSDSMISDDLAETVSARSMSEWLSTMDAG